MTGTGGDFRVEANSAHVMSRELDLSLDHVEYLRVKMDFPSDLGEPHFLVCLQLADEPGFGHPIWAQTDPLEPTMFWFALDLTELPPGARLKRLRLDPIEKLPHGAPVHVTFRELVLLARD
jgi:hypothetical protein